jgi:hypothetical protein
MLACCHGFDGVLHMCVTYVCDICVCSYHICVRMLLYMYLHATICVRMLLHMCPHIRNKKKQSILPCCHDFDEVLPQETPMAPRMAQGNIKKK